MFSSNNFLYCISARNFSVIVILASILTKNIPNRRVQNKKIIQQIDIMEYLNELCRCVKVLSNDSLPALAINHCLVFIQIFIDFVPSKATELLLFLEIAAFPSSALFQACAYIYNSTYSYKNKIITFRWTRSVR